MMRSYPEASFGELLQRLRKQKKVRQRDLAEKLGVHRNTIGSWERGDRLPVTRGMVLELARHLHLSEQETRQLLEASLIGLPPTWNIPYPRNPFFTGREEILRTLHQHLAGEAVVALTQSYALHGLGGIGKTHLALEYAYRYGLSYAAVFWIAAENAETIVGSLVALAHLLQLPEWQEADQQQVVVAVQRWLSTHRQWLLIWDNVDDLTLLQRYLPATRAGSVLLTTRRQALGTLAQGIELPTLPREESLLLLLRRAKVLGTETKAEQMQQLAQQNPAEYQAAQRLVAEMDGLPLALDQAGAYIEETSCRLVDYEQLFEARRVQLLSRRGEGASSHPASVVATWELSFEWVQQADSLAGDLLRLCASLSPDAIPEELLIRVATSVGQEPTAEERLRWHEALRTVFAYSLLRHQREERTCTMHRLVQAVLKAQLSEEERRSWRERAMLAVNAVFPHAEPETWSQCERLLSQALFAIQSIEQDQLGGEEAGRLLHETASYLLERARYAEAEPLLQRALRIREQQLGPEHTSVASTLHRLAILCHKQSKYAQAELLFQRALRIREQQLGPEHAETAHPLSRLAILYYEQGKYAQAEPLYQRALHIYEQQLGSEHPHVASTLNNLANFYRQQGKYGEAEPLYQRALHIFEQRFGPQHPQVTYPLNNLGELYRLQGKYAAAEPLFQRALRIREQQLGSEHPDLAHSLNNLADLYFQQGKYGEAEPLYQRALHIFEQQFGPEHPSVSSQLNGLANLYHQRGKYREAESLYQQALRIREQQLGVAHPETAETLHDLAQFWEAQGKSEEARSGYARAMAVREQALGKHHPKTMETRARLIALLRVMGRHEEAAQLEVVQSEQ